MKRSYLLFSVFALSYFAQGCANSSKVDSLPERLKLNLLVGQRPINYSETKSERYYTYEIKGAFEDVKLRLDKEPLLSSWKTSGRNTNIVYSNRPATDDSVGLGAGPVDPKTPSHDVCNIIIVERN